MEDFDHEFDTFEEPAEVKTEEVNVEYEPIVYESQLWLMGIITALIIINHFSSKWIDLVSSLKLLKHIEYLKKKTSCRFQITKLITPAQQEVTNLVNQINALKKELDTISQSEEFAKYSKIERKILKYRQELDSKNKSSSGSMLQAKAAFNTVWLTIMVIIFQYFFFFF